MRTMSRVLLAAMLACAAVPALAQEGASEPTLAEQAARARATQSSDIDTRIAGKVADGVYRNEFLGFEVHTLPQWEAMNRGQMNVNEAAARSILGLRAGVDTNVSGRVFGMHDGRGQTVAVGMRAILATDTQDFARQIDKVLRAAIPGVQITKETALLGDSAHPFDGVRVRYVIAGVPIVQSLQYTLWRNYLITITSTSTSPEQLTALLRELRPRVTWIGAAGQGAPASVASGPARTPPPSTPTK